mgnify:CR=1 FL=1
MKALKNKKLIPVLLVVAVVLNVTSLFVVHNIQ